MAKKTRRSKPKQHRFRNKLLLNQWLMSLFGIDPLEEQFLNDKKVRPFHKLTEDIKDPRQEGLGADNLHKFFHNLIDGELFRTRTWALNKQQLLTYEENIGRHTQAMNDKRHRKIVWKYYQWLTLLFTEIYLDRYFQDKEVLLEQLNDYVERFNDKYPDKVDIDKYSLDDLNKVCLQNATGSGKTLLMHVQKMQYEHYARMNGKQDELSRTILITPNERLSEQHMAEFQLSDIQSHPLLEKRGNLYGSSSSKSDVDVLEITKLGDQDGPNTIATRSLGDQNLLLVDEGHRGMSGKNAKKDESTWYKNRAMLSEKGFTFEYSATFEQAVSNTGHEDDYAKMVLFDYSYRWFYEDGFGKDYQILNLPKSFKKTQDAYMTACLLKFYQQLRIYEEHEGEFAPFHIEKPLWVFVGSTVSAAKGKNSGDEKTAVTDIARILQFIAEFLQDPKASQKHISDILTSNGQQTGLVDEYGHDIFDGAFNYLAKQRTAGESAEQMFKDLMKRLFNNEGGGMLTLDRIKGDSGEVALHVGQAEEPFGLINVGDAKGLCDHLEEVAEKKKIKLVVQDSDFKEAIFSTVKDSASPINLLIGSKKFVEGWDCWRVSTMGLMHVGQTEGAQIIQLFGRGVRLKGYNWSLKRSGHANPHKIPPYIHELETLNVFGIKADFMEKFRQYLSEEGLPGNERRKVITIPLNVTYDFGKKLKVIRPKIQNDGVMYDFKKHAPVPIVGDLPEQMSDVESDWYPRIQRLKSAGHKSKADDGAGAKETLKFAESHLAFLDFDKLYFEIEQFKREKSWYNLNITKAGIRKLLTETNWYTLYYPKGQELTGFDDVLLLQQVAAELIKRYCERYYNYCRRAFLEPRLELVDLTAEDENIPNEDEYQLIVDSDEQQVILAIEEIKQKIESGDTGILKANDLFACQFGNHLFQPLFHVRKGGKITVLPVSLNESEFKFVSDLKDWCEINQSDMQKEGMEVYLLRNLSRGKGVGFFEANGFYPDFILWVLNGEKQYVSFVEPHGLMHEGEGSEKIQFHQKIKEIEERLGDPSIILNSFILSCTEYRLLQWKSNQEELERQHVLFMDNDAAYIEKLLGKINTVT